MRVLYFITFRFARHQEPESKKEPEPKKEQAQVDGDTLIEAIMSALMGGRADAASGQVLQGWLQNTGSGFARRLINDLAATPNPEP